MSEPTYRLKPGNKYRNNQGVVLELLGPNFPRNTAMALGLKYPVTGWHSVGTVWVAVERDSLFGDRYLLVTPDGLVDCGYELVQDGDPSWPCASSGAALDGREWGIRTFPKNGASDITIVPSREVAEGFAEAWRGLSPEYRAEVVWRIPASEWEVLDV